MSWAAPTRALCPDNPSTSASGTGIENGAGDGGAEGTPGTDDALPEEPPAFWAGQGELDLVGQQGGANGAPDSPPLPETAPEAADPGCGDEAPGEAAPETPDSCSRDETRPDGPRETTRPDAADAPAEGAETAAREPPAARNRQPGRRPPSGQPYAAPDPVSDWG